MKQFILFYYFYFFLEKKGCLENDRKTFKETKENIQDSFNSKCDNKIMIVNEIVKDSENAK